MTLVYELDDPAYMAAHFDVRKGYEGVWQFHVRFGAKRTLETKRNYFNSLGKPAIASA